MDEHTLSQEEINLLLQTLGKEEEKREVPLEKGVKPLDINALEHIYAGRIASLELIFERWITNLKRELISVMVSVPTILKEGVSSLKFSELISKLPFPSAVGYFNLVFGGSARPYKIEGKDFTKVEMRIVEKLLKVLYNELQEAWRTLMDVNLVPVGIETNPAILMVARSRDRYIVLKLTVSLEGGDGFIILAIPEEGIEPYKEKLKGLLERRPDDYEKLIKALTKVPIHLSVKLGKAKLSLKELYDLKVGDTIILENSTREPVEVYLEGVKKFLGVLGHSKDKKAFKVIGDVKE
ncbi:FliM/FliN family flagellar motor switch protein [Thermocrinis sp.]|uniref:flagellar motor switch protein FliM n=1 Tax=Thermocrinis sp. TaxID=2024383 RepID=UPI002FDEF086